MSDEKISTYQPVEKISTYQLVEKGCVLVKLDVWGERQVISNQQNKNMFVEHSSYYAQCVIYVNPRHVMLVSLASRSPALGLLEDEAIVCLVGGDKFRTLGLSVEQTVERLGFKPTGQEHV